MFPTVDDADANMDNTAGSLIFLARTCVKESAGDSCSTGLKEGTAVTVCNQHCREDGCNMATREVMPAVVVLWLAGVGILMRWFQM